MAVINNYEVELLTVQYTTSLDLLLQQENTRLRGTVSQGSYVGKQASPVQYIGPLQFKASQGRGMPIQPQIAGYQRRWVSPQDKVLPVQVDTFDQLRTIIDPKSALSKVVMAAANRLFDDVIIASFFGSALQGVDSSSQTTETFNSGSNFPSSVSIADTFGAGSACGLTVKKLIEGRRILRHYENDLEANTLHIAIGSQQEADLLNQLEFVSDEYRKTASFDEMNHFRTFMGYVFHFSERLPISGSDHQIPVWIEDGMHLGLWKDMETIISQRNDLEGHPWQSYTMISLGATRLQGGKVLQINCVDSTGGDITI